MDYVVASSVIRKQISLDIRWLTADFFGKWCPHTEPVSWQSSCHYWLTHWYYLCRLVDWCLSRETDPMWEYRFLRNRYYISIARIILLYLQPPFYPPFCLKCDETVTHARACTSMSCCRVRVWLFINKDCWCLEGINNDFNHEIYLHARHTYKKNAMPLSRSGFKFALHRFVR